MYLCPPLSMKAATAAETQAESEANLDTVLSTRRQPQPQPQRHRPRQLHIFCRVVGGLTQCNAPSWGKKTVTNQLRNQKKKRKSEI